MRTFLKTAAITVAVLFALMIVLTSNDFFFFGSSKVRTLFGASADALAGDPDGGTRNPLSHRNLTDDAGF